MCWCQHDTVFPLKLFTLHLICRSAQFDVCLHKCFELGIGLVVLPKPGVEVFELLLRGELSIDEKERNLDHLCLFCQLVYRKSSVLENAFVSINERYPRYAANCVHESRIKAPRHSASLAFDLKQLGGNYRIVFDIKLILLAGSIVYNTECILFLRLNGVRFFCLGNMR